MLKSVKTARNMKLISVLLLFILIFSVCFYNINGFKTMAAQSTEGYNESKLSKYPGYVEAINNLKSKHPNWNFKLLYTGLDWNQVIKNETTANHGANLVEKSLGGTWVCPTCGNNPYDTGAWVCASEIAVSYYMDPRNWITEDRIFQFEELKYDSAIQTQAGVNQIVNTAPWMRGDTITYNKTDGSTAVINKSYSQIIMEAAKAYNVSPYHLASRIVMEQGKGTSASSTGSGKYPGYEGYYNFFNFGATGSTKEQVIKNAYEFAKKTNTKIGKTPWTNPEITIKESAYKLSREYIGRGQNTLYLQKFDVDNSDGSLYSHQYMQNVSAVYSEGYTIKKSYSEMGMLGSSFTFVIPVYENMPAQKCLVPTNAGIVTQNVQINGTNVQIRETPSLVGVVLTKLNTGDKLLRIETASSKNDGYVWDKIVLSDGRKGYVANKFISQVNDITNCNISAFSNTSVNLRNGPGTYGTTIVTTLIKGQPLTIIEKDVFNNLNGYNWVRVKLSNGIQGYIASQYITEGLSNNFKKATINCNSDSSVNVRASASTSAIIVTSLAKGAIVTVTQENATEANGYVWDKIVSSDGIEGFVANKYLIKEGDSPSTVTIKYGDANGDGIINSGDLLTIKKHLLGSLVINDSNKLKAMDVNKDGTVNSGDLLLVKKHLLGTYTIQN